MTTRFDVPFTLPTDAYNPSISVQVLADNVATVSLNGQAPLLSQPVCHPSLNAFNAGCPTSNFNGTQGFSGSDSNSTDFVIDSNQNNNTLRFAVEDDGAIGGNLSYSATVTYTDTAGSESISLQSGVGTLPNYTGNYLLDGTSTQFSGTAILLTNQSCSGPYATPSSPVPPPGLWIGVTAACTVNHATGYVRWTSVAQADLAVSLNADHSSNNSSPAVAGNTVTYTATVTNNGGPSDNTGYTLTLGVPDGTTVHGTVGVTGNTGAIINCSGSGPVVCTSTGTLAPNASDTYTLTLDIGPGYADTAPNLGVPLHGTASLSVLTPSDQGGATANDSASKDVLVVGNADLVITTDAASAPVVAGTNEVYTINVANSGPSNNIGYTVADTIPAHTTYVSSSATGASSCATVHNPATNADVTGIACTSAGLAKGGNETFTLTVKVASGYLGFGSSLTNTATIDSTVTPDPHPSNNTNTTSVKVVGVSAQADLQVGLSPATGNKIAGQDSVAYAITVTNNGPSDATAYTVTMNKPANTSVVGTPDCSLSGTTFTCTSPGTLAPGSTDTFHVTLSPNANFADGAPNAGVSMDTTASLATNAPSDQGGATGNDSASSSVLVKAQADLGVSMTDNPSANHLLAGQDSVNYAIVVHNYGPSDNTGYSVSLAIPSNTTLHSLPSGCSATPTLVTCTSSATLASGSDAATQHLVLDIGHAFANNTPLGGVTLNPTATVTPSLPTDQGSNTNGDTANSSETVYGQADLSLSQSAVKLASPSVADDLVYASTPTVDRTAVFTLNVTNVGPSDAITVSLADAINDIATSGNQGAVIDTTKQMYICAGTGCTPNVSISNLSNIPLSSVGMGTLAPSGTAYVFRVGGVVKATFRHGQLTAKSDAGVSTGTPDPTSSNNGAPRQFAVDTVPEPPTINTVLNGNTQLTINWSAPPANNGGTSYTGFKVYASPCPSGGSSCVVFTAPNANPNAAPLVSGQPTTYSYVISGFQNNTTYALRVTAINAVGESDQSAPGTGSPNVSADSNTLNAAGSGGVVTGTGAVACPTGVPSSDPTCKNVVGSFSLTDSTNPFGPIGFQVLPNTPNTASSYVIPCLGLTDDLFSPQVIDRRNCVASKAVQESWPGSVPHLSTVVMDASDSTLKWGYPCRYLKLNSDGTPFVNGSSHYPVCLASAKSSTPLFPTNTGSTADWRLPHSNMCAPGFGWTPTKPCALIYYDIAKIAGFRIPGTTLNGDHITDIQVPTACAPTIAHCGEAVIIASSVENGIRFNATSTKPALIINPWCSGAYLPCITNVSVLTTGSGSAAAPDIQWSDTENTDYTKTTT